MERGGAISGGTGQEVRLMVTRVYRSLLRSVIMTFWEAFLNNDLLGSVPSQ